MPPRMAMQYSDESADADETEPTLYEQRGFSTSHILVKHSGSARQASWRDPDGLVIPSRTKEDAAATLSKLREELQELDGERRARRFAELAFEVSDCGTAREGGHLGDDDELKLDEFEEEFEAAIHSLGAWELSKIVETDSGSHLIMRLPNGFDASPNTTLPEPPNSVPDRDEELASMDQTDSLRSASIGKPKAKAQNSQAKYTAKKPKKPKHLEQLHGSTLRQQEERKMRELFEKADTDGGGTLQLKEIKQLCRDMGDRISTTALEEGFYRMDPEKTGKADFEAFRKWWRLKEDTSRREMRKNVAEIFHMMDADGNGTLDRTEIGLVAEKIASKYSGAEFDPPFDLATDYAAMDTHGRGHVTYDEFAAWFKVRSGDDEPEVPVLPEYMVTKVKDLTADGEGLGDRSGKELWKFLRLRLKVLVKLQNQWGRVQDLYGTGGNLFESHTIPDGLYDPDSLFMKYWDVFQFFALTYILLIIPVRVGFAVEVPLLSFPFILDAIIDIYFIVDIYLNFNTAMWLPNGVLETNRKKIRRAYLRGWFTIDIISTAPLTYMLLIGRLMDGDTRGERNGYQRMLRLAKIVRFKRIRAVLKKYEDNGVIGDVTPYLGSMGTIATIIISGHFLACLWFHAGMRHGSIDCDPEHEYADILGRIGDTDCVPDGDGGHHFPVAGWVLRQDYPEATSLGTKYIDSVYSVFKSKFAYTGNEMRVGILSELVLGLIFGSLAGVISAIMMTLGAGQQDAMLKLLELRAWMRARDLKVSDKVKILAAFNTQNELAAFNQKQILGELPPSLAADISYYMYGKYIERIPLFRHLGKEVIAETCKWVKDVSLAREQVVYQEGKYGTEMYFIVNGEVEVSFDGERLGFLGEGAFFGEAPLINSISGAGGNGSNIRTRTVRTLCTCELGVVREEDVLNIMARYPELRIRLSNFNLVGKNFSAKGRRKAEWNTLKSEVIGPLGGKPDGQLPTLLPPLQEKPGFDPAMAARMQAALEEEKARGAADRARAAKEAATLRGVVETLRESLAAAAAAGAAAAAAAPSAAPSAVSSTAQAPRPLRPDEEEVVVEVTEGRMAKGIKTAFLPSEGHFRTVDQAAAAVLRAQSQVMKAQADLLRACAYSPAAADAALKVQTDAALSETILASLLAGMNESTEAPTVESLQAKANLANVMGDMADPAAAQPVYREVVSAQTAALGPDHLETLQTKHNQAIAMKKSGDHAGARRLLEEVIEGLTEQLGATHAKTIESKCDLAAVLRVTGEQTQARHLYEEAIEARSAELGPKHAATLTARFNLASLLDQMNEREIARDMYEEVIEGQTETLGPQHTETLDTMYNLADLLESRRFKDFSRVRELFVAVAAGYQEAHGPDHAETLDAEERLRRANFRLKAKRNAAVHAVAAVSRAQSAMGGLFDEGGARPSSADL